MARGDRSALANLYEGLRRDVYAFVARVSAASKDDVDDLVQETFIEAFRSAGRFRGDASPRTWLLAIAANRSRKHIRSRVRRRAALAELARTPAAPATSPERVAASREDLRRVALAIDALPPAQRVAYVMCVVNGAATNEAARVLGVRRATMWRRIHDARSTLRRLLEQETTA